jgi:hypothetical protein
VGESTGTPKALFGQNMNFLTQAADGVANNNNGATFQWYIAKVGSFDGINLKTGVFLMVQTQFFLI